MLFFAREALMQIWLLTVSMLSLFLSLGRASIGYKGLCLAGPSAVRMCMHDPQNAFGQGKLTSTCLHEAAHRPAHPCRHDVHRPGS